MDKVCCDKEMVITFPPWGTLAGFFHPKFYGKCKECGKEYIYHWNSCPIKVEDWGYHRREVTEEDRGRL